MKLVTVTWLSPLLSKKLYWNTLRHTWDTVILLKTTQNCFFKAFWEFCSYWNNKIDGKPQWICMKLVIVTCLLPLLTKKLHFNTLRHTWDTVILLKTAYFKHFVHFPAIEIFETIKFAANHCEYVWNWSQ